MKETRGETMGITAEQIRLQDKGKGAIFIRAFLEYLQNHGEAPLLGAQTAGVDWLKQQDASISLNYLRTCCRNMQSAGLIEYSRKGRNWGVSLTDKGDAWTDNLPEDWGTEVDTCPEGAMEAAAEEVKRKPNRRIKGGTHLPTPTWRAYLTAQKAGDLDIIFVKAGTKVKVIRD
jgi:hypothetical protein